MRRAAVLLAGAVAVVAGVLGVEAVLAVTREYLPTEPAYLIDEVVGAGRSGDPLVLAVLGDSTAAGVGAPTVATTLPVLVAERVAAALDRPVRVIGYGTSGARTDDVTRAQVPRVLDGGVDVTLVVVGSNDTTHLTPWWVVDDRTAAMLRAVRTRTGAPVVLGGVPEFTTVPALLQPLRWVVGSYAGCIRAGQRAAAGRVEGARFVDIAAEASPRFLGRPESMSSDGFHPSPIGYTFWAEALAPAIADAVRASR